MENTEKEQMNKLPKVTFVTGNKNKLKELKAIVNGILEIDNIKLDLPEYQGTPEEVSTEKCKTAFKELGTPVLVEDTSLCFNAYGGLPGVYIKWFLKSMGNDGLYKMLDGFEDKTGYAQCIFAYMEKEDQEPVIFVGQTPGEIVEPRGDNNFGWDPNFQPDGHDKTYAELDKDIKNEISHRARAAKKMADYFKDRETEDNQAE